MRITRLVSGLVTTALVVSAPLIISAAPAEAATIGSTVTVNPPSSTQLEYGDDFYLSGTVKGVDGKTPNSPVLVALFVSTPANPAWTLVATDDSAYFSFSDVKPASNSTYKVVFGGGTSGFGGSANTLTPSESAPLTVAVSRKIEAKTKGLKVIGKVLPDYGKKKVKILQVVGKKKTKKYTKVKTSKKGRFTFRAPNKRGFRFVVVVPGDANFAGTFAEYHVI
ncbi:hypothetical protein [Nocardioides halotolerans]|jgi:hypothetical protein|uniref:hypothetical protein n=1 Tax=Nocardioides halotolerans TaxID=433660 RepID=UPI0004022122|nr:hypothetical protein [Nocardioides halotolerans]